MKRFYTAVLLTLLIACPLAAQELPKAEDILDRLIAANDKMESFKAEYTQVEINEFDEEFTRSGLICYQKPGSFYMSYSDAKGKLVEEVAKNQDNSWRIHHRAGKVDKFGGDKSDNQEKDTTGGVDITNPEDIKKAYNIEVKGIDDLPSGKAWHLVGKAKETRKYMSIEVWVNIENNAPISKLISVDKNGNKITFTLENITRNSGVDSSIFKYHVPSGYKES